MTSAVVLFHHALGRTAGLVALADFVAAEAEVSVTTPDLFDGLVFSSIDDGVAHAESIGFAAIADLGANAVGEIAADSLVVVGISLGVLPAMKVAQTDDRVRGACFIDGAVPLGFFGETWPGGVALQIHGAVDDPWFIDDVGVATELSQTARGSLTLRPGSSHLTIDPTAPGYDAAMAAEIRTDAIEFVRQCLRVTE